MTRPLIVWIVVGGVALALLVVAALLVRRASRSPLKPHMLPLWAWAFLTTVVRRRPVTVAAIALVIASGAGWQVFFGLRRSGHGAVLILGGMVWQAVMATLTAALSMRLLLYVMNVFPGPTPAAQVTRPVPRILLLSGAYGFGVWLLDYLIGFVGRTPFLVLPPAWVWPAPFVASALAFLLLAPLALARPLLALGADRPVLDALTLARRFPLPLYVMSGLLLIPPTIVIPLSLHLPQIMLDSGMDARPVSIALVTLFSITQFLAVEMAMAIFARQAVVEAAGRADSILPAAEALKVRSEPKTEVAPQPQSRPLTGRS